MAVQPARVLRQALMTPFDPYKNTKGRHVMNHEVVPHFASLFKSGDKIFFIGRHRFWDYSPFFNNPILQCEYTTTDMGAGEEPDLVDNINNTNIRNADGIIFIGMDTETASLESALANIRKALKPGGRILVSFTCQDTRVPEKYRQTFASSMNYMKDFIIDEISNVYGNIWNQEGKRYEEEPLISCFVIARKRMDDNS